MKRIRVTWTDDTQSEYFGTKATYKDGLVFVLNGDEVEVIIPTNNLRLIMVSDE